MSRRSAHQPVDGAARQDAKVLRVLARRHVVERFEPQPDRVHFQMHGQVDRDRVDAVGQGLRRQHRQHGGVDASLRGEVGAARGDEFGLCRRQLGKVGAHALEHVALHVDHALSERCAAA